LLLLFTIGCAASRNPFQQASILGNPLFNQKDLSGWHVSRTNHHGTQGDFAWENDRLVMKQNPYGMGGILLTDDAYGDIDLYLEYRGTPGTNGGVLLRSSESGSAYQLEIVGDGEKGTGTFFGEMLRTSTSVPAPDLSGIWKKQDWNAIHIQIHGITPFVTLWINGIKMWEKQMERNDLLADVTEGMIGLQLHWSSTHLPVPGGSCCEYSWKPGAFHSYRNVRVIEKKER
jgi:hypothetical protein